MNSINLSALNCLKKIELLQKYVEENTDKNIDEKVSLIASAHFLDNQSLFACLPKEVIFNEIYAKYDKIALNKFIFFSCPPEIIEKPGNKNEMDGCQLKL